MFGPAIVYSVPRVLSSDHWHLASDWSVKPTVAPDWLSPIIHSVPCPPDHFTNTNTHSLNNPLSDIPFQPSSIYLHPYHIILFWKVRVDFRRWQNYYYRSEPFPPRNIPLLSDLEIDVCWQDTWNTSPDRIKRSITREKQTTRGFSKHTSWLLLLTFFPIFLSWLASLLLLLNPWEFDGCWIISCKLFYQDNWPTCILKFSDR